MLWLAVHFPTLPLEVFTRQHFAGDTAPHREKDKQQPWVVLDNNRVCQRNAAAARCGIVLGTTLATAHSICPTLLHQQKDPQAEQQRLNTLANTLYRFSSYTCIQAPDCILLEIGGSLRLFGHHEALRQTVLQLCRTLGHDCVASVAKTTWAAIALARSGQSALADVPLAAAGLDMAGVPPKIIERFDNMGIYTLGPLLELPTRQLGKRFGTPLLTYIGQLTGTLPDPRTAIHPAPGFHEKLHLLQPITDKATLCHGPMLKLAGELQQWLICHQLGCTELQWQFFSKQSAAIPLRFADARQNADDMMQVSQLRLEQIDLPTEVLGVGLLAKQTRPWQNNSLSLFPLHLRQANANPEAPGKAVYALVDELNARLGDNVCKSITCLDQHTPENAWCAYIGTPEVGPPSHTPSNIPLQKRPLWLFDPPRQIQPGEIELLQGPERIQSNWWQATTCRDYYIARHRSGAECWAFIDPEQRWYLHGYFS